MTGDETDKQVQRYITELKKRGCIINTTVAIAVGEGILLNKVQISLRLMEVELT